jgi:hypothetical protein
LKVIKYVFEDKEREFLPWTQKQKLDTTRKLQFTKLSFINADTAFTQIIVDLKLILNLACFDNNCNGEF